ncbi:MAG: hypothetical protein AABY22_16830 [Nanoarchaeota archaeon]|mgnify:CR=1 FL=1
MKNKSILFLLISILVLSSIMIVSSAGINSLAFNTANYSEHDTNTPAISVTVIGNSSAYYVTFYVRNQTNSESVRVGESAVQVVNATATNITLNDITFATSRSFLYNVTAYNDTNNLFDGAGATGNFTNGTTSRVLEINQQPVIQSVVKRGNNVINALVPLYKNITWTVNWTDVNSTSNDSLRLYSCKTNSFDNGCATGQTWGISPLENDGSTITNYTATAQDVGGSKNFYLFLLDDNGWASAVSSGTFQFIRGGSSIEEIEAQNNPTPTPEPEKKKSPWGTILIIGAIVLIGYLILRKKK